MGLVERYLGKTEFGSYEEFIREYRLEKPETFNFAYDIVDEWARLQPDKTALIWCSDSGEEQEFTFREISELSDRAANLFRRRGIGRGDRVMLMLRQRPEVWICMVALHKLGAVVIPASFQLTPKDIEYRCNAAEIRVIVCADEPEMVAHVMQALPACSTVGSVGIVGTEIADGCFDFRAEMQKTDANFERVSEIRITDPMLIYFSSGTTGMPKMVLHDFSYPLGHIVTAKYWQQADEYSRHMTAADSGWAKFGWSKIYGQWICGAAIIAYDEAKFDPKRMLATIARVKPTFFCAPPTVYRFLLNEQTTGEEFVSVKMCATAGEPLNPEVWNKMKALTGLEIKEGFGQSETSVILASFPWFPVKPGSTGKPSPLYDIDIVDSDGNSCEDGIVGRIVVKNADSEQPAGLFREYYLDEGANARARGDGVYDTGDTAWRDSEGYFWFVGRNDDVIKCSGYRIGPFEVENALHTHPAVLECAVTAVPDPIRGQVVKATIVLKKGFRPSDELTKEIQTHVKKVTAPYKYPRVVEFVDALPKTTSGKIRRMEIRQRDGEKSGR